MARRYRSSPAQRRAIKKARKERPVPGTLEAFGRTSQRNVDGFGSGPGWFEKRSQPEKPSPKHSQAAQMGHRAAGRGGGGGDKGHSGKPSSAETKAAHQTTRPVKPQSRPFDGYDLLVPEHDPYEDEEYPGGIEPGYYTKEQTEQLKLQHKDDPASLQFIAEMRGDI